MHTIKHIGELIDHAPGEYYPIPHNPNYLVNDQGIVVNRKQMPLAWFYNKNIPGDYRMVWLFKDGRKLPFKISRLVLMTFRPIENPKMYEAHHIDEIRTNDILSNLAWRINGDHDNPCQITFGQLIAKYGEEKIHEYLLKYEHIGH